MKKLILVLSSLFVFTGFLHAQTDSITTLGLFGDNACKCIDSISLTNKDNAQISADIKTCIDKQVIPYEMSAQLFNSLTNSNSKTISIDEDPNSDGYRKYYYQLESWLRDSCTSLKNAVRSDNTESENSMSKDPKALKEYNAGEDYFDKLDYVDALPYFQKAVAIDPKFVFAWDNLGVCYRNTNEYDKALDAYQKSLALDPKGRTPLINIPVVYIYQKKYDEALIAYQNIINIYPNDPEMYYGAGIVYTYDKIDLEKALDDMCKAYNIYTQLNSPYREDAQKTIGYIYSEMKKAGKEDSFMKILKNNNISVSQ